MNVVAYSVSIPNNRLNSRDGRHLIGRALERRVFEFTTPRRTLRRRLIRRRDPCRSATGTRLDWNSHRQQSRKRDQQAAWVAPLRLLIGRRRELIVAWSSSCLQKCLSSPHRSPWLKEELKPNLILAMSTVWEGTEACFFTKFADFRRLRWLR